MKDMDYTFRTVDGEDTLVCMQRVGDNTFQTTCVIPKSVFVECFNRWCLDDISSGLSVMQTSKNHTFELRGLHVVTCGGSCLINRGHSIVPIQIALSEEMCFGHSDIFKPCEYSNGCLSVRRLLHRLDRPDGICSIYAPEDDSCKCWRDDTSKVSAVEEVPKSVTNGDMLKSLYPYNEMLRKD